PAGAGTGAITEHGLAADDPVPHVLMTETRGAWRRARDRPANGRAFRVRDVHRPALAVARERGAQLRERRARAHGTDQVRGRVLDDAAQLAEIDGDVIPRGWLADGDARAAAPEHDGLAGVVRGADRVGERLG